MLRPIFAVALASLAATSLISPVVGQSNARAPPSATYDYTGPTCGDIKSDTCPGKLDGSSFTGAFCTNGGCQSYRFFLVT